MSRYLAVSALLCAGAFCLLWLDERRDGNEDTGRHQKGAKVVQKFEHSTPQSSRGSTAGTGVMPNTAHACTPAKLLSGIVPASRAGGEPGKYTGFNSVHPDCKMEQWPMGSAFRERLRGRSMFLIGDCWERRLIEHVCKGKVIAKYDEHEPFAIFCEVMPNVTIGHLHIGGVGELHSEATAEYMTRRMASMPTRQRITEMLGRFRRERLGGRDPTLVLVRGSVETKRGSAFGQLTLRRLLAQRRNLPQAAPSPGQPRPISQLGRAGRPHRPYTGPIPT